MCDPADAQRIADTLPDNGSTMVLQIANHGAQLLAI